MTDEPTWDGHRWSDDDPKTDAEKHAWCKRRSGVCAIFVPPTLYVALEQDGSYDMRRFVITKPIPIDDDTPTVVLNAHKYRIEHELPTGEQMRAEMQRKLDAGEPLGASHVHAPLPPGTVAYGCLRGLDEYAKLAPSDKPRWPCRGDERKSHKRGCSGFCMMGLNGACVACGGDDW